MDNRLRLGPYRFLLGRAWIGWIRRAYWNLLEGIPLGLKLEEGALAGRGSRRNSLVQGLPVRFLKRKPGKEFGWWLYQDRGRRRGPAIKEKAGTIFLAFFLVSISGPNCKVDPESRVPFCFAGRNFPTARARRREHYSAREHTGQGAGESSERTAENKRSNNELVRSRS